MDEIELKAYPLGRLAFYAVLCCPANSGVRIYNEKGIPYCNVGVNKTGANVCFQFEEIAKSFHIPLADRKEELEMGHALTLYMAALKRCGLPHTLRLKASAITKIERAISETDLSVLYYPPLPGTTSQMLAEMLIVPGNWLVYLEDKVATKQQVEPAVPLVFQSRAAVNMWAQFQALHPLPVAEDQTSEIVLRYAFENQVGSHGEYNVCCISEANVATHRNNYLLAADNPVI